MTNVFVLDNINWENTWVLLNVSKWNYIPYPISLDTISLLSLPSFPLNVKNYYYTLSLLIHDYHIVSLKCGFLYSYLTNKRYKGYWKPPVYYYCHVFTLFLSLIPSPFYFVYQFDFIIICSYLCLCLLSLSLLLWLWEAFVHTCRNA